MPRRRDHIPLKTQLAAALCQIGEIPYEHAKGLTPEQVLSLFHLDHGIFHAWEVSPGEYDKHWNMRFRFIAEHREKTKTDIKIIAKTKRLTKSNEEFRARLLAKADGEPTRTKQKRNWPSSKIPSRPFPSRKREQTRA